MVLLSILCHIWKIVPDLYEAIIHLSGDSSGNNAFTQLASNSTETQEELLLSKVNISGIDYRLNSNSNSHPEYDETNGQIYLEESNEALENILMADGGYLNISNCSDILSKLGKHYNLTGASVGNFLNNSGGQAEVVVEVRYSYLLT